MAAAKMLTLSFQCGVLNQWLMSWWLHPSSKYSLWSWCVLWVLISMARSRTTFIHTGVHGWHFLIDTYQVKRSIGYKVQVSVVIKQSSFHHWPTALIHIIVFSVRSDIMWIHKDRFGRMLVKLICCTVQAFYLSAFKSSRNTGLDTCSKCCLLMPLATKTKLWLSLLFRVSE